MTETEAKKNCRNENKAKKEAIAEMEHQRIVEELKKYLKWKEGWLIKER